MSQNYNFETSSEVPPPRGMPVNETISLEGNLKQALETGRNRLLVTGVIFMKSYM